MSWHLIRCQSSHETLTGACPTQVVHGRDICEARLVDDALLQTISDAAVLAPLHNHANLQGISAAAAAFACPQVRLISDIDDDQSIGSN
jgi:acetate kinase